MLVPPISQRVQELQIKHLVVAKSIIYLSVFTSKKHVCLNDYGPNNMKKADFEVITNSDNNTYIDSKNHLTEATTSGYGRRAPTQLKSAVTTLSQRKYKEFYTTKHPIIMHASVKFWFEWDNSSDSRGVDFITHSHDNDIHILTENTFRQCFMMFNDVCSVEASKKS